MKLGWGKICRQWGGKLLRRGDSGHVPIIVLPVITTDGAPRGFSFSKITRSWLELGVRTANMHLVRCSTAASEASSVKSAECRLMHLETLMAEAAELTGVEIVMH